MFFYGYYIMRPNILVSLFRYTNTHLWRISNLVLDGLISVLLDLTIMISFSPPACRRMLTLISTPGMFARSRWSWLNCFSYNWRTPPTLCLILQYMFYKFYITITKVWPQISCQRSPPESVFSVARSCLCLSPVWIMTRPCGACDDSAPPDCAMINTPQPPGSRPQTPRPPTCQEFSSPLS